jgi:6,7-dimethyl-8-ribityllumazine synthase
MSSGVDASNITELQVPGCLEIGVVAKHAADSGKFSAIIAVGCIIRGETSHFEVVRDQSASALTMLSMQSGMVIGNAILACENSEQALARCGLKGGNKGSEAAAAVLAALNACARIQEMRAKK